MELDEYDHIAAIERDYWWYRNTRGMIDDLLGAHLDRSPRILDLGAATGAASSSVSGRGTVVALDRSVQAMGHLRQRPVVPVRAVAERLPFGDAAFDVVLVVNLLYSVDDPAVVLAEVARTLAPGGALLLLEPAFPALERPHDVRTHGQRRFRRPGLVRALDDVGLVARRTTYAYSFLAPVAAGQAAVHRVRRATMSEGTEVRRRPVDGLLGVLSSIERSWLQRGAGVGVGTSVLVLAERPAAPVPIPAVVAVP